MTDKRDIVERLMDYDQCHDGDVDEAVKEIVSLRQRLAAAEAAAREEVDEFNAGYKCAMDGGSVDDQPSDCPYDVWEVGFAWAMWNKEPKR